MRPSDRTCVYVCVCTIAMKRSRREWDKRWIRERDREKKVKGKKSSRTKKMLESGIADGWEVSPEELDYRVASVGFENSWGSRRVAGEVGAWLILHTTRIGQVWEIGLAFWLVCPLCPSRRITLSKWPFPSLPNLLFLYRECLYAWTVISTWRAYIHVDVTYTLREYPEVSARERRRRVPALVSLAGDVEGDWPRTSDLCDLRGRIYERSRPASSTFISHFQTRAWRKLRRAKWKRDA